MCIFYNPLPSFTLFPSPRCHLQSERCRSLQETLKSLQKQTLQRSLQRAALKPRSTLGHCVTLPRLVPIGKHLGKHRSIMKHHLKHSNHSIFRYDLEVFGRTEQELVANLNAFRCPAATLLCGGKMIQYRWRAQRVSNRLTPVPGWMPGRKQKQKAFPSSVKGCNIDNLYQFIL